MKRIIVTRNKVDYICRPGYPHFKCGKCGRGRIYPRLGWSCRVCRATVTVTRGFEVENFLAKYLYKRSELKLNARNLCEGDQPSDHSITVHEIGPWRYW